MISCLLALHLAFSPPAESSPPAETSGVPRWLLAGAVTTVTPAALNEGLALGLLADLQRQLTRRFFLSARLGYAASDGANRTWRLEHQQFEASLAAGLSASRGVGRVWAQLGGGVMGLHEVLSRQPSAAVVTPGVPFGNGGESLLFGPQAFGELGVALALRGP